MGRKKGSKNKLKGEIGVAIPYERSVSDDPVKQSMIDLMETGRAITHFSPDGMRRIDPLGPEATAALYNAEHPDQLTQVAQMSHEELKERFPDAVRDLPHAIGRKPGVAIDLGKIRENLKTETPYPKDWEKMSKTEKLTWYNQNRK
jgi:hypothetical protein